MSRQLQVMQAPIFGAQIEATVPHGMTVAEIVATQLPDAVEPPRVFLATSDGVTLIPPAQWKAKPRPHARVIIRPLAPEGDKLRGILQILVTVAAAAIAGPLTTALLGGVSQGALFGFVKAGVTLGLTTGGGLLLNAIFPPRPAEQAKEKPVYAISSLRNGFNPDGPLPKLHGTLRVAPVWGVRPYTEVVGGKLYVRAVGLWGHGPLAIPEGTLKIGDTPLSKFDEVTVETRYGLPGEAPLTLVTRQTLEKAVGTDLTRPLPRGDDGEIIDGPAEAKPVSKFSAADSSGFSAILFFPQGMLRIDTKGREKSTEVRIGRRQRLDGVGAWTVLPDLVIQAKEKTPFYRQISWDFTTRGRWEVEFDMLTEELDWEDQIFNTCNWALMQSIRPEYPFNFDKPVAMTALRIRATAQLNGPLDEFNGLPSSIETDWVPEEGAPGSWVPQATTWPPAHAIEALTGRANPFPVALDAIDWPAFEEWGDFCIAKRLRYNRLHDFAEPLGATLKAIGAAGRAVIKPVDGKWTVIIDRPQAIPAAMISARNSSQFKWHKEFKKRPHGLRVPFRDQTNGYGPAERIVRWPGFEGDITLTEQRAMPWVTDPDQIYVETRRFMHETDHRDVGYSAIQAGAVRSAQPGDLVVASRDIFTETPSSARVRAVRDQLIELDAAVTMRADTDYAIEFMVATEQDPRGYVATRNVSGMAGQTRVLRLAGTGDVPAPGTIVHFGPAGSASIDLIMLPVERGKNNSSVLRFLPAAPEIDALTDADAAAIPVWTGRVGTDLGHSSAEPAAPVFTSIETGTEGTGDADGLVILLRPGSGSTAIVGTFRLQHRLAGAGAWSGPLTCDAAEARFKLTSYPFGSAVEFQAWAISTSGVEGPPSPIVGTTIGAGDFPIASMFDFGQPRNLARIL